MTWLHFNLSDARARRWLLDAQFLPSALRDVLQEHAFWKVMMLILASAFTLAALFWRRLL